MAAANRPVDRAGADAQHVLNLVHQLKRVSRFTVHLVDEDDYGGIAHTAHLHKLTCLCLHTFRSVDHDDGRVDSCKRAVGILTEVLVTRSVEDIHLVAFVVELHN